MGCPHESGNSHPGSRDGAFAAGDLGVAVDGGSKLPGNSLPLDGGTQPLSTLAVRVLDGETLQPMPATLLFRSPPGSGFTAGLFGPAQPDPANANLGAVVAPGVLGIREGVMLVDGVGEIPLPAGSYKVIATRGPEFEQVEGAVSLTAGQRQELQFILDRTVDTTGWLSADLHVHAGASYDSKLLVDRRVIAMAATHVELIVPTDHNIHSSFASEITALGYDKQVGHITGNEFNFEPGHGGAYPVPYDPLRPDGGAFPWTASCSDPGKGINCYVAENAFDMLRALMPGVTAVAINHPWWGGSDLGYFTNIGWGAGTDQRVSVLPSEGHFDALELMNAYLPDRDTFNYLLEDWFTLLDRGNRVAALGNSDSHGLSGNRVGYPRNWLRIDAADPSQVTPEMLGEAVRKGRVVASSGPFLDMQVEGAQIGDTLKTSAATVKVTIELDAPDWIAVSVVNLYVNGESVKQLQPSLTQRPRLKTTVDLAIPAGQDSYVLAIASSDTMLPADVVGHKDWRPIAIANPVYIDGDGNDLWKPTRLRPRPLSAFDPRSVPIERLLDRPQHRGEGEVVPNEHVFDWLWSNEQAKYEP